MVYILIRGENWPGNMIDSGGADFDDYYVIINGKFIIDGWEIFSLVDQEIEVRYFLGTPFLTQQSVNMKIVDCNGVDVAFHEVSAGSGTKKFQASKSDRFNILTTAVSFGQTRHYDLINDKSLAFKIN